MVGDLANHNSKVAQMMGTTIKSTLGLTCIVVLATLRKTIMQANSRVMVSKVLAGAILAIRSLKGTKEYGEP